MVVGWESALELQCYRAASSISCLIIRRVACFRRGTVTHPAVLGGKPGDNLSVCAAPVCCFRQPTRQHDICLPSAVMQWEGSQAAAQKWKFWPYRLPARPSREGRVRKGFLSSPPLHICQPKLQVVGLLQLQNPAIPALSILCFLACVGLGTRFDSKPVA